MQSGLFQGLARWSLNKVIVTNRERRQSLVSMITGAQADLIGTLGPKRILSCFRKLKASLKGFKDRI